MNIDAEFSAILHEAETYTYNNAQFTEVHEDDCRENN